MRRRHALSSPRTLFVYSLRPLLAWPVLARTGDLCGSGANVMYVTSTCELQHCQKVYLDLTMATIDSGYKRHLNSQFVEETTHAYEESCGLVLDPSSCFDNNTLQPRHPPIFPAVRHIVRDVPC